MPELPHHRDPERSVYTLTRGWRQKDAYGGLRDYGDTDTFESMAAAQQRRNYLLRWSWADDEFKVDPWVGPIMHKTFRVDERNKPTGSAEIDEIGRTIRREDPTCVPSDSRMQMRRVREELARRFSLPKDDS